MCVRFILMSMQFPESTQLAQCGNKEEFSSIIRSINSDQLSVGRVLSRNLDQIVSEVSYNSEIICCFNFVFLFIRVQDQKISSHTKVYRHVLKKKKKEEEEVMT